LPRTAYFDDKEVALNNGCNDFISKPFSKEQFYFKSQRKSQQSILYHKLPAQGCQAHLQLAQIYLKTESCKRACSASPTVICRKEN